jgi:hypothetical protein
LVTAADRLLEVVRAVRTALPAGSPAAARLVDAAGRVRRVRCPAVDRRARGPLRVGGTAPHRRVSIPAPDLRHGRQRAPTRFAGHTAAVAVDTAAPLITAVAVLAGNAPDATGARDLVAASAAATDATADEP